MVDFERNHALRSWIMEHTGGPAAGGLTVRDVMAITAMGVYLEDAMKGEVNMREVAENAYKMADMMLDARIKLPEPERCSVEEAFGL